MKVSYREHVFTEKGQIADLNKLEAKPLPDGIYKEAHRSLVIPTHDAVVTYNDSIVLVERDRAPLKDFFWSVGGRINRGVPLEESLKRIVKKECGLEIYDIEFAGVERAFMPADPFGHGRGTDTVGLIYLARGKGEIKLDEFHKGVKLVSSEEYDSLREKLHPFIRKYTDEAMRRIRAKQ